MINRIKKEIEEIKNRKAHLKEQIYANESVDYYKIKLQELSKRSTSGFTVDGNTDLLILKFGKHGRLAAILYIIFLGLFLLAALKNINEPLFLAFPALILALGLLNARYWTWSKKLSFDLKGEVLIIENNHWLGRYLGGRFEIPFIEILKFDKKLKSYSSNKGPTQRRHQIRLITKSKTYKLFELNAGPIYFINEDLMIKALKAIIGLEDRND